MIQIKQDKITLKNNDNQLSKEEIKSLEAYRKLPEGQKPQIFKIQDKVMTSIHDKEHKLTELKEMSLNLSKTILMSNQTELDGFKTFEDIKQKSISQNDKLKEMETKIAGANNLMEKQNQKDEELEVLINNNIRKLESEVEIKKKPDDGESAIQESLESVSKCQNLAESQCELSQGCVFCVSQSKCKAGDLQGPFDGSCSLFNQGVDCSLLSCSLCQSKAQCHWCKSSNKCSHNKWNECEEVLEEVSLCNSKDGDVKEHDNFKDLLADEINKSWKEKGGDKDGEDGDEVDKDAQPASNTLRYKSRAVNNNKGIGNRKGLKHQNTEGYKHDITELKELFSHK